MTAGLKSFFGWLRRRLAGRTPQIPAPLWQSCMARLPFLHRLTPQEQLRLQQLCEHFLDKKPVIGAADLEISDEMAVLIAMQACLPVLNLTLDLYDDMSGVIVYPGGFIVPRHEIDDAGVVHEWCEPLSGEAIDAGGAVVLSWEDAGIAASAAGGCNVVIHEFAHKLDMVRGGANGCPPFLAGYHDGLDSRRWQRCFGAAFDDFRQRVDDVERHMPDEQDGDEEAWLANLPLDPYAATDPAEFFAVASETFFLEPHRLATHYPEIHALLAGYFRQDPA
jgi:Mlc titration factor MtfA (ptsG expression regulator)